MFTKDECKMFVSNGHEPLTFTFCKHYWDPKDVLNFLTLIVLL
jgi:hypothetical protein